MRRRKDGVFCLGLKAFVKKNKAVYKAALIARKAANPLLKTVMTLFHGICGVEKNKVYFSCFHGRMYNESPKYICEALHEIYPEGKFVFRLNKAGMQQDDIPPYVIKVKQLSLKMLYHMATAKVIVKNTNFKPYMKKFADQYYVQTWHGDRGYKRIALDAHPDQPERYPDNKYMDLALAGSTFARDISFRRAFRYDGEILMAGVAKNDILVHPPEGLDQKVRAKLGIKEGEKVLLYAPTFRDKTSGSRQKANFSLKKLKDALENAHGCKWRILVRGHMLNTGVNGDEGTDVSLYPDVSELLLISDMLITDYSSIAYDYILLNRPVIHFHADREEYVEESRKFQFDPEELPFIIAHSEEELIKIAVNPPDAEENCREICDFYGVYESGNAAMQAAEYIRRQLP